MRKELKVFDMLARRLRQQLKYCGLKSRSNQPTQSKINQYHSNFFPHSNYQAIATPKTPI